MSLVLGLPSSTFKSGYKLNSKCPTLQKRERISLVIQSKVVARDPNVWSRVLEFVPAKEPEDMFIRQFKVQTAPDDCDQQCIPPNMLTMLEEAADGLLQAYDDGRMNMKIDTWIPGFFNPVERGAAEDDEDFARMQDMCRYMLNKVMEKRPELRIKALVDDYTARVMLEERWPDVQFLVSDLEEVEPIVEEDELVVLLQIEPENGDRLLQLVERLLNYKPHVLFNCAFIPRNVGHMGARGRALESFIAAWYTQAYLWKEADYNSISYVVRKYPYCYQVFVADKDRAGRYRLVYEEAIEPHELQVNALVTYQRDIPFTNVKKLPDPRMSDEERQKMKEDDRNIIQKMSDAWVSMVLGTNLGTETKAEDKQEK